MADVAAKHAQFNGKIIYQNIQKIRYTVPDAHHP